MFDPHVPVFAIDTFDDAGLLAFSLAEGIDPPAPAFVVVLDEDRRVTGSVLTVDHDDAVAPLVELAATMQPATFLVVSDHAAGSECDPDDVLEWEELHGAVESLGATLLDWLVITGDVAYSKARFAPTPGLAGPPH